MQTWVEAHYLKCRRTYWTTAIKGSLNINQGNVPSWLVNIIRIHGNKDLKVLYFIKKLLEAFEDERSLITCVDEVGFSSHNENLRRYGNLSLL